MTEIKFIDVTENSFSIIRDLAYKIWPISYKGMVSDEQIYYMLNERYTDEGIQLAINAGLNFKLAEQDKEFVGFLAYSFVENKLKLNQIYVLPETQGSGIGKQIMDHVVEIAREKNLGSIILTVNRNNPAVNFYKHLDFKIIDEKDFDIGNGFLMNDYIMEKIVT